MGLSFETRIFIGAICILAVFFHVRYDQKTSDHAPTILTTLGIFATFFAIALGLLKFDSLNIQDSVPALLDSMKTAFWASVAGVGWALTFNFRKLFERTEFVDDSNIDRELLKELKGLRSENNQNIKELTEAQNQALDKISKSSSDELVKALQEVIRDFNAKINEQFGENFKQLNEAVAKLLDWQKQYKVHIETSTESLSKITQEVQAVSEQFENIVKDSSIMTENSQVFTGSAEAFKETANSLEATLGNLDVQREAIQSQIESLSTLVSKASDDLPDISNKILNIANTMKSSATDFNNTVSELSNSTKSQTDSLTTGLEEALTQSLNSLGGQLSAMTEKFASDYNQLADALSRISRATKNNGR
ncbi:hypothetical protein ACTXPO_12805 [Psychrobacter celer]|uniref:hypothetical protein n=1 Tax=Psychrobacter celer TaxID=306572 RepID=UPI003FD04DAB